MNSCRFKHYRAYSISFNSSIVGKFFRSRILKDCIEVQEKKKKFVILCLRPPQNVSRRSRTLTAKKCRKKRDACAKLLFCVINLLLFLPFLLPSSLLKLPTTFKSRALTRFLTPTPLSTAYHVT